MPEAPLPIITSYWEVDLGGQTPTLVQSIDGLGWTISASEYRSIDAQGNPVLVKVPGNAAQGGTLTLRRAVDTNADLWKWFSEVHKAGNDPSSQKKDLILTMKDQAGTPVKTYNVKGTYPSSYEPAAFNAANNEVAMESLTIEFDAAEVSA